VALAVGGSAAHADGPAAEFTGAVDGVPKELAGVGIVEKLGTKLPMDAVLVNEAGQKVTLGSFFTGKPVILNFVYYNCPMLCTLALNGLMDVQKQMEWKAGDKFQVVSISFDPSDTPELAGKKKANYLAALDRPATDPSWAFLTGDKKTVKQLADAAGFTYKWVEEQKQFSHGAGLIVLTPDGVIARYLGGVMYEPETLRLALVEASGGKIGTMSDMFKMLCGRYDVNTGKYVIAAWKVMRLGGALTVGVLLSVLGTLWLRDSRRRKATATHVQPRPA
jgi:protein SCO1/2